MAGRDGGVFACPDWPKSFTFWQGEQDNLLIGDNQTLAYRDGDTVTRRVLSGYAWGQEAAPIGPARAEAPSEREPDIVPGVPLPGADPHRRRGACGRWPDRRRGGRGPLKSGGRRRGGPWWRLASGRVWTERAPWRRCGRLPVSPPRRARHRRLCHGDDDRLDRRRPLRPRSDSVGGARVGRARARRTASLMRNLLGLRIAMTSVGIAGSLVFSLLAGYRSVVVAGVAIAGCGLMFQNMQSTLSLSLVSRLRLGLLTATEIGRQALTTILTILFVALGLSLLWFIGLTVPVIALSGCDGLAGAPRGAAAASYGPPRMACARWPGVALLGCGSAGRDLLSTLGDLRLADCQPEGLGYFATSFRILEVLVVIPGLMVTGVFPIFARAAIDEHERFAYAISRASSGADSRRLVRVGAGSGSASRDPCGYRRG